VHCMVLVTDLLAAQALLQRLQQQQQQQGVLLGDSAANDLETHTAVCALRPTVAVPGVSLHAACTGFKRAVLKISHKAYMCQDKIPQCCLFASRCFYLVFLLLCRTRLCRTQTLPTGYS
jgi:hypothetical protein